MTTTYVPNEAFQVGGIVEPISTDTTSLLSRCDPTTRFALDYFAWIIRNYPGDGLLLAAITKTGLRGPNDRPITDAVMQMYPDDPVPYLASNFLRFPCLAMYRKDAKYRKHSAGYYDDRAAFDLIYLLPPLDAGQASNILPILTAIEKAIRQKTVQSFDPQYTPPGGTLGDSPWGLKYACVEEIGFDGSSRGKLPDTNMVFPYLLMSGFVIERDMPLPGPAFAGADITVNLVAPDGTSIPNFMAVSTQGPPTLTSVTPATGTISGGTGITLAGTLFLQGASVLIGTQPATSVVVASNGLSLTCVTPQVGGSGTVDVRVTNPDGQSATLIQTFTFTSP